MTAPQPGYEAPDATAADLPTVPAGPAMPDGEWVAEHPDLIRVEDLARLDYRPGDVFVYRPSDPRFSVMDADAVRAMWLERLPGAELVILPPGEMFTARQEQDIAHVADAGDVVCRGAGLRPPGQAPGY